MARKALGQSQSHEKYQLDTNSFLSLTIAQTNRSSSAQSFVQSFDEAVDASIWHFFTWSDVFRSDRLDRTVVSIGGLAYGNHVFYFSGELEYDFASVVVMLEGSVGVSEGLVLEIMS